MKIEIETEENCWCQIRRNGTIISSFGSISTKEAIRKALKFLKKETNFKYMSRLQEEKNGGEKNGNKL